MSVVNQYENAVNFMKEGKGELAVQLLRDCVAKDPLFGPAYLELHNYSIQGGNIPQALQCLEKWYNCPVTPVSLKAIPKIEQQMEEYRKKLNPKPVEVK